MIAMKSIEVDLATLPEGELTRLVQDGEAIVVLKQGTEVKAFIDVCPHAGWRLSDGEMLDAQTLECPGHTWRFDLTNGQCTDVPIYKLTPVTVVKNGTKVSFQW